MKAGVDTPNDLKIHGNALQAGYRLHWYGIQDRLGQGGFGITYLAHDFNLDEDVAIKEYLPVELAIRESDSSVHPVSEDRGKSFEWGRARFMEEARTLAKFKHPNIVRVRSVFEENNTAYMVMEYENGHSLQEILAQQKTLEEQELTRILLPIMDGLQLVHDAGFIHRDIKPANIFIRGDGSPVLLDFGSARQALGAETKTLTSMVSPGYAPFEQYYSSGVEQGPWTDIYGLAATVYRAMVGRKPQDAVDRSKAILNTNRDTFVGAQEIGAGLYSEPFLKAVDHGLSFKAEDRPRSLAEWKQELEGAVAPVASEAPTTIPEQAAVTVPAANVSGEAKRAYTLLPRRWRIVMAASLGLALVAGALWWVPRELGSHVPASATAGKGRSLQPAKPASSSAPGVPKSAPQKAGTAQSVAVLPFENLSADKNNAYFADGMQDMILTKLADIGGLKVISRTSTERYASHPGDLKIIGKQLGVAAILEGSVQRAGDEVLINVQLINARTDNHIWAQSYQRALKSIFGVEGEVAQKVAAALKARIDPAEKARVAAVPTHNSAAYDAFLHASSAKSTEQAIADLRQAVKLDPNFALAWAALSDTLSGAYFNAYNFNPAYRTEAKQALGRARALAPDAVETQLALGNYDFLGLKQLGPALAAYHKALEAAPNNSGALAEIGDINRQQGHWQKAIDYFKRCLDLNPRSSGMWFQLGWSYEGLHQYGKAEEMFRRALAISPDDLFTIRSLVLMYQSEGDLDRAAKILADVKLPPTSWLLYQPVLNQAFYTHRYAEAVSLLKKALATPKLPEEAKGAYYQYLGFAEHLVGDTTASRRAYEQAITTLKDVPDSPPALGTRALAQAGLGQKDAALVSMKHSMSLMGSNNHWQGPIAEYYFAVVQAQVGLKAKAIATLKHLLATPPGSNVAEFLTPALLRLNPFWNPLRKDPDFKALLAQYPVTLAETNRI